MSSTSAVNSAVNSALDSTESNNSTYNYSQILAATVGASSPGIDVTAAVAAAIYVPLKKTLSLIPVGILMGIVVMTMTMVHSVEIAFPLLFIIGALSGYFVVPMNALLQHRGYVLMSAGHSIAVQNFNENLSILTMLPLYACMLALNLAVG